MSNKTVFSQHRSMFNAVCRIVVFIAFGTINLAMPVIADAATTVSTENASQENQTQAWGTHGMAIFGGRDGLYASHLPMFHAPHNMQVIIRFHLLDSSVDDALRKRIAQRPQLWTMEPEKFDLMRLKPGHGDPLKQFSARLVQGHFERDGIERFSNQQVVVDDVLLFRSLDPTQRTTDTRRFQVIGTGRERFLVNEIDQRPDFGLIVALKPLIRSMPSWPTNIVVPSHGLQTPSVYGWNDVLRKRLGQQAAVAAVLYFDTEDLQ